MGEAPARSSLVPRDLTAELCLIALASLGLSAVHVRLTACLNLLLVFMPITSLGHVRFAAFFISFC